MRLPLFAVIPAIALAALAAATTPARATPDDERIDRTMHEALDEVYQRELPGYDADEYEWRDAGDPAAGGQPGTGGGPNSRGRVRIRRVPGGNGTGTGSGAGDGTGSTGPVGPRDPVRTGSGGGSARTPPTPTPAGGSAGLAGGGSGDSAYENDGTPRSKNGTPGDPRRRRNYGSSGGSGGSGSGGAFSGVAQVLLWGLVIVAVLLLIVFIVRQTSGMTGQEEPVKTADEEAADPSRLLAVVERPRDDADQLAHEGRFADAIHILLLRTVHELASQNLVRVTPAMTSREVLARVPLLGDARTALANLVNAVELTWFGDDVPGAGEYAACRAQFEVFAAAYRRGAVASPHRLPPTGAVA